MHLNKGMHFLVTIIGLKVGWLACVLGGANDQPWLGPLVVAGVVSLHVFFADRRLPELKLVGVVMLLGLVWDSLVVSAGLMQYPSGNFAPGIAPYWILAMWALFATALNTALSWLKGRLATAAIFGAIGGAMAYYGGYKLGGVDIPDLWLGLGAQAAGWALIMPLLTRLAVRFDGVDLTRADSVLTEGRA